MADAPSLRNRPMVIRMTAGLMATRAKYSSGYPPQGGSLRDGPDSGSDSHNELSFPDTWCNPRSRQVAKRQISPEEVSRPLSASGWVAGLGQQMTVGPAWTNGVLAGRLAVLHAEARLAAQLAHLVEVGGVLHVGRVAEVAAAAPELSLPEQSHAQTDACYL